MGCLARARARECAKTLSGADEETHAIPILAVTAFAMPGDQVRVLSTGCDDYLAKPFNVEEFLRMVNQYTSSGGNP